MVRTRSGKANNDKSPKRPAQSNGAYWLYGLHALAAALENPARRILDIQTTLEGQKRLEAHAPGLLQRFLQKNEAINHSLIERTDLDRLIRTHRSDDKAVHQGVAARVKPLSYPPAEQMMGQLVAASESGMLLLLDHVTDPRNCGAILRTAAAFGVAAVIAPTRHAPPESAVLAKAASGALDMVPYVRCVNLTRFIQTLKGHGVWSIALSQDGTEPLHRTHYHPWRALVLGGEGDGLRRLTHETCDLSARIDLPGTHASGHQSIGALNVATAAAIGCYELSQSRPD